MMILVIDAQYGICQHTYQFNYFAVGYWNSNTNKYDWNPKHSVDLQLTIRRKLLQSMIKRGHIFWPQCRLPTKTRMSISIWMGIYDEKERSCILKEDIIKKNGQYAGIVGMYILYKSFAYYYEVSEKISI